MRKNIRFRGEITDRAKLIEELEDHPFVGKSREDLELNTDVELLLDAVLFLRGEEADPNNLEAEGYHLFESPDQIFKVGSKLEGICVEVTVNIFDRRLFRESKADALGIAKNEMSDEEAIFLMIQSEASPVDFGFEIMDMGREL